MQQDYIKEVVNIQPVRVSCEDQETLIVIKRDATKITLSISDNKMLTRIKRLMSKAPDLIDCRVYSRNKEGQPVEYEVDMPIKCLSFRVPRQKRVLTDDQRKAYAERMRRVQARGKQSV